MRRRLVGVLGLLCWITGAAAVPPVEGAGGDFLAPYRCAGPAPECELAIEAAWIGMAAQAYGQVCKVTEMGLPPTDIARCEAELATIMQGGMPLRELREGQVLRYTHVHHAACSWVRRDTDIPELFVARGFFWHGLFDALVGLFGGAR